LPDGFKYGDLTLEACFRRQCAAQYASISVELRKPIIFVDTIFNEELDSTGPWDSCKGKLCFRRFKCVSDAPAEPECAIKSTCKRHTNFVSNSSACANGIVNDFGDRTSLRFRKTGVEQNETHMSIVESEYIRETMLVDSFASTVCATENDLVSLTSVSAEMNDLWFVQQQQLLKIVRPRGYVLV